MTLPTDRISIIRRNFRSQAGIDQDWMYGDHLNDMVTFIDNHDRNRFLTEAGGDVDKLHNALTFIFTAEGSRWYFRGLSRIEEMPMVR